MHLLFPPDRPGTQGREEDRDRGRPGLCRGLPISCKGIVALLGVMVGVFVVSFLVAYIKGQQVWGVSNIIPWGQLITFYIFFIGLSAGAIIISSLSYVFN